MRSVVVRLLASFTVCLILISPVFAQAAPAKLAAWSVLPASTLADGPQAGVKLGSRTINGLKVPFASQPVGNIVALVPGDYANSWMVLSNSTFDSPQNSGDYLLRLYTVEVSWRDANGGDGNATVVDWLTLTDPAKKVTKAIRNPNATNRPLSGGDFTPRAFARLSNGALWIAESSGPSLLHFSSSGQLLEAPIALSGAGALQSMSKLPDNKTLIIAQRSGSNVVLRTYDTSAHAFGSGTAAIALASGANSIGGLAMVNDHQAVVVEQDNKQGGAAQFKQVFLVDMQANSKTPLVDLLNVSDPDGVSGKAGAFKFPFADIGAIYPLDAQTLMIANDNNVPFDTARAANQADDTEFIAVQIGQPLSLDGAFAVPR